MALAVPSLPAITEKFRRPFIGVWDITKRIYREFSGDRIPTVAGGITFFVLLAIFPGIAATVSLYGMFARPSEIVRDIDLVSGFLPGGAVSILRAELHRLTAQKPGDLNVAFAISFVGALWSASGGYKALVEGLNVAFEVQERRSFLRQTLNALLFTAGGIVLAADAVEIGMLFSPLRSRPNTHTRDGRGSSLAGGLWNLRDHAGDDLSVRARSWEISRAVDHLGQRHCLYSVDAGYAAFHLVCAALRELQPDLW